MTHAQLDLDLAHAILAKTPLGQEEIQTRALRLPPMLRRLLLLVDGQRRLDELAAFVAGQDVKAMLRDLLAQGCISAQPVAQRARVQAAPGAAPTAPAPLESSQAAANAPAGHDPGALLGLPPAESRSAKELEMARNFMINTLNTMFGPQSRLTLVKKIFDSKDSAELRTHFADWDRNIGESRIGARRLPELREKLFAVL